MLVCKDVSKNMQISVEQWIYFFTFALMKILQSIFMYILPALLSALMAGCNSDVFIEPLVVDPAQFELGPDNKHVALRVKGDWSVKDLIYDGDEGRRIFTGKDMPVHISTPFSDINVSKSATGLEIDLEYYLGTNKATVRIVITNGIFDKEVTGTVYPTDLYTVEIEKVEYVLDQWSGWPDEDCTKRIGVVDASALSATKDFVLQWPVTSVPTTYKFETLTSGGTGMEIVDDPENFFAGYVVNSGVKVPVPSTSTVPGEWWTMAGQELPLRLTRVMAYLSVFPPLPAPVTIPVDTSGKMYLCCRYESVGFNCTITARNPATKELEKIQCMLRILMPMELFNLDETTPPDSL